MKRYPGSVLLTILMAWLTVATGCGGGSGKNDAEPRDTGSLSFRLAVNPPSEYHALADSPSGDICVDYGIQSIKATMAHGTTAVRSAEWICSHRNGRISGIPAGEGYRLVLEGVIAETVMWRGEKQNLTIVAGEQLDAGEIALDYVKDDTQAPFVSGTSPTGNQTHVPLPADISITFSEAVVSTSVTRATAITIVPSGGTAIGGDITYDAGAYSVTFNPTADLSPLTAYTVTVGPDIEDMAGQTMAAAHVFTFTTRDPVSPTATVISPADGAENVRADAVVVARFSKAIDPATLNADSFIVQVGGRAIRGHITYEEVDRQATFSPVDGLDHSQTHTVTLTAQIRDLYANPLAPETVSVFNTASTAWYADEGALVKLSSAQEILAQIDPVNCAQMAAQDHMAVDPNDGSLWASDAGYLIKTDRNGRLVLIIPQTEIGGIAVDPRDSMIWTTELDPDSDYYKVVKRSPLGFKIRECAAGLVSVPRDDNAMTWYAGDNSLWMLDGSSLIKLFGDVPDGYNILGSSGTNHLRVSGAWDIGVSLSAYHGNGIDSGQIWMADRDGLISRFAQSGALIASTTPAGFIEAESVSADPATGGVWIVAGFPDRLAKLSADGATLRNVGGYTNARTIETDPANGGAWVGFPAGLAMLSADGSEIWRRAGTDIGAIAIEPVSDGFHRIHVDGDSGDDTNGDGSVLAPYQSIARGLAAARNSDTVQVAAGIYNEDIQLKHFVNLQGAGYETTILQGSGRAEVVTAVDLIGAAISGFTITGAGSESDGIYAANCDGLMIQYNRIIDNGSSRYSQGIHLGRGARALVSHNIISGNSHGGIDLDNEAAIIRNNLIIGNAGYGIYCGGGAFATIINNVIHGNGTEPTGWSGIYASSGQFTIENNIITGNGGPDTSSGLAVGIYANSNGNVTLRNNNVYNNYQGNYTGLSPDPGSISSDPLYINPGSMNFQLTSPASPSLNSGNPQWMDTDCTRSDMGAYGGPWGDW